MRLSLHFFLSGGGAGPPAPPRGRPRGPMTREEAQRLREEEMASQAQGKDCFIIPQANLDRFLPDGVTVSHFQQSEICCFSLNKREENKIRSHHFLSNVCQARKLWDTKRTFYLNCLSIVLF